MLGALRALGATAQVDGDALVVHGGRALHGGIVDAAGDHRIAMASCVGAAAAAPGSETTVVGWESVQTSYPGFADDFRRLRAS